MDDINYEKYKWLEAESQKPQKSRTSKLDKQLDRKLSQGQKKIKQQMLDFMDYLN